MESSGSDTSSSTPSVPASVNQSSPEPAGASNISVYEKYNLDPTKEILQLSSLTPEHLDNLVNVTREYPSEYATVVFGYAMPIVLLFSMVTNTLLIMVLNTNTFTGPVNQILLTLAKVDILTVAFPAPWYFYLYTLGFHNQYLHPPAACYIHHIMTDVIPVLFHTASIWLTSFLAFHRFLVVCIPNVRTRLSEGPGCVVAVRRILWFSLAHQFLRFFDSDFVSVYIEHEGNYQLACYLETAGWVHFVGMSVYYGAYFMIRILFVSIIPCVILLVINCLLYRALRKAEIRMSKLTGFRAGADVSGCKMKRLRQSDRLKPGQAGEREFSTTDMRAQLVDQLGQPSSRASSLMAKLDDRKATDKSPARSALPMSSAFKFARRKDKAKSAAPKELATIDGCNRKQSTTEEFSSDQFFRGSSDKSQTVTSSQRAPAEIPSSGSATTQNSQPACTADESTYFGDPDTAVEFEAETSAPSNSASRNYDDPKLRKGVWATSSVKAHFGGRINKCASYESRYKCSCQSTPCSLARTFWPSYPDRCSCTSSDCVDHQFRSRSDHTADWTRTAYSKSESCVNCFKDELDNYKPGGAAAAHKADPTRSAGIHVIADKSSCRQASRSAGPSQSANTTSTTLHTTSNNSNTAGPTAANCQQQQQHVRLNNEATSAASKSIRKLELEQTRSPSNVSVSLARPSKASLVAPNPTVVISRAGASACEARIRDNNRTTAMLIVMVTLFLMVEVPVAVATIFHLIANAYDVFHTEEYRSNVKSVKLFANSCIILSYSLNFFIYCIMSARFRMTLAQVAPFTRVLIGDVKTERNTLHANSSRVSQVYSASCANFNKACEPLTSPSPGRPIEGLITVASSPQIAKRASELSECAL